MLNIINLHLFLFSIFLNLLITSVASINCWSCNRLSNSLLVFSRITLAALPIQFSAGFTSFAFVLLSVFGFTWILSKMSILFDFLLPCLLIGFGGFEIWSFGDLGYKIVQKLLFRYCLKKLDFLMFFQPVVMF